MFPFRILNGNHIIYIILILHKSQRDYSLFDFFVQILKNK